jgi:hypothetical protein
VVENQVYLQRHEYHVQHRIQGRQDVPRGAGDGHLEEGQEFQSSVDEGADAEEGGPDAEEQGPVALVVFADQHFDGQLALIQHRRKGVAKREGFCSGGSTTLTQSQRSRPDVHGCQRLERKTPLVQRFIVRRFLNLLDRHPGGLPDATDEVFHVKVVPCEPKNLITFQTGNGKTFSCKTVPVPWRKKYK